MNSNQPPPICRQCGKCCQKGGPLLHIDDMPLIYEGHICLSKLVSLRKGELAYNAVTNELSPLKNEVIKLAGKGSNTYPWHCVLHDTRGCNLHPLRPAQCQALFCEDITELAAMYEQNRATRKELLAKSSPTWFELSMAHEEEFAIEKLALFIEQQDYEQVLYMLRYELSFRQLCIEKAALPEEFLNAILGRKLSKILSAFGLGIKKYDNTDVIMRIGKSFY